MALAAVLAAVVSCSVTAPMAQAPPACATWQACRDATEQALSDTRYEEAHDLAWRAVQRGPKDDPALLALLARTQALSGRTDDALVMVRRLADRGVLVPARTDGAFARLRGRAAWADLEARLADLEARLADLEERLADAPPPSSPAAPASAALTSVARLPQRDGIAAEPAVAAPSRELAAAAGTRSSAPPEASSAPPDGAASAPDVREAIFEERVRLSSPVFRLSALVYDVVSARWLLADRDGRKIRVLGDGFEVPVDLVRADSAGFGAVTAAHIDRTRGDLWVASGQDAVGAAGGLHRLQLVSGRPLQSIAPPADLQPWHPVALHVTRPGVVTADDQGQVWLLAPGGTSLRRVATVPARGALTMTATPGRDDAVLVASETQVFVVALGTGRVTEVTASHDSTLYGIEQMATWHDRVVVIQRGRDGRRYLAHWRLPPGGRQATAPVRLAPPLAPDSEGSVLAVVGDEALLTERTVSGAGADPALRLLRVRLR